MKCLRSPWRRNEGGQTSARPVPRDPVRPEGHRTGTLTAEGGNASLVEAPDPQCQPRDPIEMLQSTASLLAGLLAITAPAPDVPVSLSGSPQSMERQHAVAVQSGYAFVRTPRELREALEAGVLVEAPGDASFALKYSNGGATRPEVVHFLRRFGAEYLSTCGDRMVVTSLTRPLSRQPRNAHRLSVHPAGMAIDLRVPRNARCRRWFEGALLELESQGVLDVTRERRPAHYHLALFPDRYLAHLGLTAPLKPAVTPLPAPVPPEPRTAPLRKAKD